MRPCSCAVSMTCAVACWVTAKSMSSVITPAVITVGSCSAISNSGAIAWSCITSPPTRRMRTPLKNAQQTTPGAHRKRNQVHVTYPYHPLTGQTVEVVRPYHRKEDQAYWDIALPDGTRAFVPESWTQREEAGVQPLPPPELDARAVLALAKIVADLRIPRSQRGAPGHAQAVSPVGAVSPRAPRTAPAAIGRSQSQATSHPARGQP